MTQKIKSDTYSILEGDYSAWFGQVVMALFYGEASVRDGIKFPPSLELLFESQGIEGGCPEQLVDSQAYLNSLTQKILEKHETPDAEVFASFLQAYEGFSGLLQRLEKDALLQDFGMDRTTGMRSSTVMITDLARELERRARRGQPFSVAMVRIDNPELRAQESVVKLAAACIQKTMRSFDDSYVTSPGEFLISLKHSDTNGAMKFATRLEEERKLNTEIDFTMSCCVAEPLPGDDVHVLVKNIREDLDRISSLGSGTAGEYEDLSPLSRYLQSVGVVKKIT
ncbi:MAG: hypothetical protein WC043_01570 [Pseudobdellovibrionaceae bacterium]